MSVATRTSSRFRGLRVMDVLPVLVLIVALVFFAITAPAFWTAANLTLISGEAGTLLLASLGVTLVIITGSIDLSIGSIVMLSGVVVAKLSTGDALPVSAVIAIALAVGAAAGLLNGIVFVYGHIPTFIVTLGSLSLLSGVAMTLVDGRTVSFSSPPLQELAIGQWIPHVQNAALIGLVVFALVWMFARGTRFGVYLYAIGGNERVVALSGIRLNRYKTLAFVLSGLTAAAAGVLVTAQLGSAGASLGSATLLDALAAIVVGGTALSGGVGGVHRTLLGVLIMTTLSNGLNQLGVEDFQQTMVKGAVIIVAALFTMASQRNAIVK